MIRVAVTGLGFMGKTHIGIYQQLANAEVVALCDENAQSLDIKSLDAGGNIKASGGEVDFSALAKYADYRELLKAGGFDVVDLCIPTHQHAEYAVQAMEAGYHVFCEKPLARSMEDAVRINDTARRTGRFVAVGQCLRFWPAYTEAKKIIDSGKYGAVRHAEFGRFSPPATWAVNNWLGDSAKSGNAALDLHVHDVDMIVFLFGKPSSLRSVGIPDGAGSFSHISTVYSYPDKSVISTGGWAFPSSYPFNMIARWIMDKGALELDFSRESVLTLYPAGGDPEPVALPPGDGYYHELQDFVTRLEEGRAPDVVSSENAAVSLEVTLREIESARSGKEVFLT